MSLTTHLGYGPFQLRDLHPGEVFARHDGTLARVCDPQPVGRPDYIQVWNHLGTSNAERLWLHATALCIRRFRGNGPANRAPAERR